jgi:hypothetical protein
MHKLRYTQNRDTTTAPVPPLPISSHHSTLTLLTLIQIARLILARQNSLASTPDPRDLETMLALTMPPLQHLYQAPIFAVIVTNTPFPSRDDDFAAVTREMDFGQENLGRDGFGCGGGGLQAESEDAVAQVEAMGDDFSDGVDGRGAHVRFGGAEAGGGSESWVSGGVAAGTLGDDRRGFKVCF